jgi:lipid-binding SYLF domain-containing protein
MKRHNRATRTALTVLCCWLAQVALSAWPDSREAIDAQAQQALQRLAEHSPAAADLAGQASGVLVFPDVVKVGFGVGGQYGEGALLIDGKPVDYFATAGASFGLQLGAQYKSEVILFMTPAALDSFRNSHGWDVGVEGGVAIMDASVGTKAGNSQLDQPIIAFIFSNQGLMGNLTLEGSKITPIAR